jgi:hypothetical protein
VKYYSGIPLMILLSPEMIATPIPSNYPAYPVSLEALGNIPSTSKATKNL